MEEEKTDRKMEVEEEEAAQAEVDIWKYIFGSGDMGVVKCAIDLGIADVIESHKTPISLTDLSSTLGCEPSRLHRIMRFLVHQKIFKEESTSKGVIGYVQTPFSRHLLRGGEKSKVDMIMLGASPAMLASMNALSNSVLARSSTSGFKSAHGQDLWKYVASDPSHRKLLDDAMACRAKVAVSATLEGCREVFDGVSTLVDVGGGNGTALNLLVKACPWMRGINFDLPEVVSRAIECQGVENVAGDMFRSVPKGDAVFIMSVLLDWGDDECIQILKNCREAIPKDKGKIIIVETLLVGNEDDKFDHSRLMLDIMMMAHTEKGQLRTSEEWYYLLKEAGFSRYSINPLLLCILLLRLFLNV